MTFDPRHFLDLASELVQVLPTGPAGKGLLTPEQEAKARTAIGRAYYAAYLVARWYALEQDPFLSLREDSHQALFRWYESNDRASIGSNLFMLSKKRREADYKLDAKTRITAEDTRSFITACSNVINRVLDQ